MSIPEVLAPLSSLFLEQNVISSSTFHDNLLDNQQNRALKEIRDTHYQKQYLIQSFFVAEGRKRGMKYPRDYHRTAHCGRTRWAPEISIRMVPEKKSAFFHGQASCGGIWTCPVCAPKIQERRCEEVGKVKSWLENHDKKGIMVTFTAPHKSEDSLMSLLDQQMVAFKFLRGGRVWQEEKRFIGFVGLIRALEITYGEKSGWHPHTHELWIVNKDCEVDGLLSFIVDRWQAACLKVGLLSENKIDDFRRHSVEITDNAKFSDYLTKFGADRELTKGSSKWSKDRCHPFDLVCEHVGCLSLSKLRRYELFADYVSATHGKRQLFWSSGLKKLVGIVDKTDEEIVKEKKRGDSLVGLSDDQWMAVKKNVDQAHLLYRAETGGVLRVIEYFAKMVEGPGDPE